MAITVINEREIKVIRVPGDELKSGYYRATVRDGDIALMDGLYEGKFPGSITIAHLKAYTQFLAEVMEAVRQTAP